MAHHGHTGARHCADIQGVFSGLEYAEGVFSELEYADDKRGVEVMTQCEPTQPAPATAPLFTFLRSQSLHALDCIFPNLRERSRA